MTTPDDAQAFRVALIYADERIKAAEAERDAARKLALERADALFKAQDEYAQAQAALQEAVRILNGIDYEEGSRIDRAVLIIDAAIARAALAGNQT